MIHLIDHITDYEAEFRRMRLLEWAGVNPAHFPLTRIEGDGEGWFHSLAAPSVIMPMGPLATRCVAGEFNFDKVRGYIKSGPGETWIIPTVHPRFIERGQSRWSAAFINDIQKAVELHQFGFPPSVLDYHLDPLPYEALDWARLYTRALTADPTIRLAFDIETPYKDEDEDDLDTDGDAPDRSWHIERIGFAYDPYHALSIPWEAPYLAAIHTLLSSDGDKVVWNAGFDVPRIRRSGVAINGVIHDGMVAWHILHTDLPKRLGFVATFTCPFQPAWKHLSGARPAFYNATDADVELRSMIAIEEELRRTGLWEVYQRDVVDLEPLLTYMTLKGMPVDLNIRLDRSQRLQEKGTETKEALSKAIPLAARRIDRVYKNTPKEGSRDGLLTREGIRRVPECVICGCEKPRKDHFKRYVKKHNPCADGVTREVEKVVTEYYRLADFTPSRDQLIRYHQVMNRPLPMVWDKVKRAKKVSFGERQILDLVGKYPLDPLYTLILTYRQIDKIAGTYIGRPCE